MKFYAMGDSKGNPTLLKFSDKSWGSYKKWQDSVYVYFTKIENSKKIFNWYETSEFNIKRLN